MSYDPNTENLNSGKIPNRRRTDHTFRPRHGEENRSSQTIGLALQLIGLAAIIVMAFVGAWSGVAWFMSNQGQADNTRKIVHLASTQMASPLKHKTLPPPRIESNSTTAQAKKKSSDPVVLQGGAKSADMSEKIPTKDNKFDWVKTSTCPAIPVISWWKKRNHLEIVQYVNSKHSGNWRSYVNKWIRQRDSLQEIFAKGGTIVAPSGIKLKGVELGLYVQKVMLRVNVINCLATEASTVNS